MTLRKLKYTPSVHAIERFREFFAVKEIYAVEFANDLMQGAKFIMNQSDGRRIFRNEEHDVMIVVAAKENRIITVLPSQEKRKEVAQPTPVASQVVTTATVNNRIIAAAHATIQRELAKARRNFTRDYRKITEEIAVIGLEIAQHTLNKARARSPITQRQITEKVSEIHARQTQLAEQRKQLEGEYRAMKDEAQAYISVETVVVK